MKKTQKIRVPCTASVPAPVESDIHDENLLLWNYCMMAAAKRNQKKAEPENTRREPDSREREERRRIEERRRMEERRSRIIYTVIFALCVLCVLALLMPPIS